MIKKMSQILWGSPAEEEAIKEQIEKSPDPADLTIENAYKTRWIWYHTILGILIFTTNMLLIAILIILAIKL